jgi:hypothetical protein
VIDYHVVLIVNHTPACRYLDGGVQVHPIAPVRVEGKWQSAKAYQEMGGFAAIKHFMPMARCPPHESRTACALRCR